MNMLIEIDLDEAKKLQLTINQFTLLRFLVDSVNIKPYQSVIHIVEDDISQLKEKKILTEDSVLNEKDISTLKMTDEFLNKIKHRDFFDEFYDTYPASVMRGDGMKDYLRGDIARCRKIYNLKVGKSRLKHEHIMSALKFELHNRKTTNNMKYMKRMSKWLSSEEWTLYDEFLKDNKVKEQIEQVYGTDVE